MKKMLSIYYEGTFKLNWTVPLEFLDDEEFSTHGEITKEKLHAIRKDLESDVIASLDGMFDPGEVSVSMKKKKMTAEWRDIEEV